MDERSSHSPGELLRDLQENYKREQEGAALYRHLAELEKSPVKKAILRKLAETEGRHAERWAAVLRELGGQIPEGKLSFRARWRMRLARWLTAEHAIRQQEAAEDRDIAIYERQRFDFALHRTVRGFAQRPPFDFRSGTVGGQSNCEPVEGRRLPAAGGPEVEQVLKQVERDERWHRRVLKMLEQDAGPQATLDAIWKREHWHHFGREWISDAIYGANDGLGAVFGLVSGVAGYTHVSHWILVSGLAGTVASALSMAAGAYLAAKSSRELSHAELAREEAEIEENPEEERDELELIYQLKGFTPDEARLLVEKLSRRPEQFVKTMAAEELGISELTMPSPPRAAISAGLSTALGAIVPVLPFFWLEGLTAIVLAATISLLAHFLVGAAKSLITVRSWWSSGLEMMGVGVLEGIVTYGLGLAAGKVL